MSEQTDVNADARTCEVRGKRYKFLLGGMCDANGGLPCCVRLRDNDVRCSDFPPCAGGNWQEDNHARFRTCVPFYALGVSQR